MSHQLPFAISVNCRYFLEISVHKIPKTCKWHVSRFYIISSLVIILLRFYEIGSRYFSSKILSLTLIWEKFFLNLLFINISNMSYRFIQKKNYQKGHHSKGTNNQLAIRHSCVIAKASFVCCKNFVDRHIWFVKKSFQMVSNLRVLNNQHLALHMCKSNRHSPNT